jgi:hypothetical protein
MNNPPRRTSRALAERHEAVWLEMTALTRQVAAIAGRRPDAMVPGTVRVVAGALIAEAACFARPRGEELPVVAGDYAGLAVQLGRIVARLDHWESLHTAWDPRLRCQSWVFRYGTMPVRRLRPEVNLLPHNGEDPEMARIREQLAARINAITKNLPMPDDDDEEDEED